MIDSDEAATPQTRYKRNRPTTTTKALNFPHALHCLESRRNLMDFADCVCQHRAFYRQKEFMPFLSPLLHCLFSSLLMSVMSFFFLRRCTNIIHLFLCRLFLLFPFIMIIRDALGIAAPRSKAEEPSDATLSCFMYILIV